MIDSSDNNLTTLENILRQCRPVLVAFSGGVDSTFLLAAALRVLGPEHVVALTAISPTLPRHERQACQELAQTLGARHLLRESRELQNQRFADNGPDRCFHCKSTLFTLCREAARELGGTWTIVYGANRDDLADHRPGMTAAREMGVRAPLLEAGLDKATIRAASRRLGLATASKAPFACLSSRFPTHTPITETALARVEAAEEVLRQHHFHLFRVRYHGDTARVEVGQDELPRLQDPTLAARLVADIQETGFTRVEIDPTGYRTGGANTP